MKKLILFMHQLFCHHKYKYTEINHDGINTIECKYCGKKKIVKINNMTQYIDKDALVSEIERRVTAYQKNFDKADNKIARLSIDGRIAALKSLLPFIDTLEVKDPYEQCVQYDSIKAGIQAHAETYSFNIESNLFNQLTKEQQKLWRKEIEQACVNGGEVGAELARDTRYKENLEVKEVDLEKEIDDWYNTMGIPVTADALKETARHFVELGLKAQKGE